MRRWRSRPLLLGATLVAALTWSGVGLAAPKDEARRYFTAAMEQVTAGQYEEAVANFLAAYEILPHPAVLYNIGRALADAGEYERSIDYLGQYLESEPIDREEVEGFISTMEARLEARAVAEAAAAAEAAEATSPEAAATASSAELEQLRRLAAELEALAASLQQRGPGEVPPEVGEPSDPVADGDPTPPESGEAPPVALDDVLGGSFVNPYSREVVTASRYAQDPRLAPSSITIISSDEIALSGATSIPDLLRQVPGIDVMQPSAGQPEVSIRGFNRRLSNKVLVLIDGRSTYADYLGATIWGTLPITLADIERIEVIRGVGSALYGASAFSGVINIITKAPGDASVDNQLSGGGGSAGTGMGALSMSGRNGTLSYRASAGTTQLGRWATEADLETRQDLTSNVEDQDTALDQRTANAVLDWRVGDQGLVQVSAGIAETFGEFYALGALRDYWYDLRSLYARGDAAWGPLSVRGYWNRNVGSAGPWLVEAGATDRLTEELEYDLYDVEVRGDHTLGERFTHRITGGVGYRYKSTSWGYLAQPETENHFSGFVQDESTFGPLHLHAALRVDKHPLQTGFQPSPRIAAVWEFMPGRALRLNAGTAFRNPTFIENYTSLYLPTPTNDGVVVNTRGDRDLAPERILSAEVGVLDHASDQWRGEVSAYVNQVDGLIDLGNVSASDRQLEGFDEDLGSFVAGESSFINETGTYRAAGAELNVEYFGIEGLDAMVNYSFERIWLSDYEGSCGHDPSKTGGESCIDRATPAHKLNVSVLYRTPLDFDVSLFANWVSAQTWLIREFDEGGNVVNQQASLDSYLVVSNRITWHPTPRVDVSGAAWNWPALFEGVGPHREHPLGQPVGARVYAEVRYRF